MPLQPINLGTPNNNDGDSLYAGGKKINENFSEIYEKFGGSSSAAIKIDVGTTTPDTSTALVWNGSLQRFVPFSSNSVRAPGKISLNAIYVTNDAGRAGDAGNDLLNNAAQPNNLVAQLDGRNMFTIQARNNTSITANVRGQLDINLGNSQVTSLSVYTTSVVIRGINGVQVFRATSEDTAVYTKILDVTSTATGVTLYERPVLDFNTMSAAVRNGTDSSNAIAHTGFTKLLLTQYPFSSTAVRAQRGIVSNNPSQTLTADSLLTIDGIYHPKHIEGLIYNYDTVANKITLVTGAAAHWSYSTSGVAGIIPTTATAIVASYNPIVRTFRSGWTPEYNTDGTAPAVIDATTSTNTWYYLYYLGCTIYTSSAGTGVGREFYPGSSNVVISSNRDIESVDNQLTAAGYPFWRVVRRLGPVRNGATDRLVPFNVKRIDHGGFEFYWGLNPAAVGAGVGSGDSPYTTSVARSAILTFGSSTAISLNSYSTAVLTTVPPIPGVTAHITVRHNPAATGNLPYLYLYGQAWTVNGSISTLNPPFEIVRSTTTSLVNVHQIQLPMSPDGCYIPDGTYFGQGILSVFDTSSGQKIRFAMQRPWTDGPVGQLGTITSNSLSFTVTGFRLAR
jgi:hypothetical protein